MKKSYGVLNPDKVIYIIRPFKEDTRGLCALLLHAARHIYYAKQKGYYPVVDFANYKTNYTCEPEGHNAWEDYFTQPCDITLEEAYKSKNVILAGTYFGTEKERQEAEKSIWSFDDDDKSLISTYNFLFKHIKFAENILDVVAKEERNIDLNNMTQSNR